MKYLVATFTIETTADLMQASQDLLADGAAEAGFESFEEMMDYRTDTDDEDLDEFDDYEDDDDDDYYDDDEDDYEDEDDEDYYEDEDEDY